MRDPVLAALLARDPPTDKDKRAIVRRVDRLLARVHSFIEPKPEYAASYGFLMPERQELCRYEWYIRHLPEVDRHIRAQKEASLRHKAKAADKARTIRAKAKAEYRATRKAVRKQLLGVSPRDEVLRQSEAWYAWIAGFAASPEIEAITQRARDAIRTPAQAKEEAAARRMLRAASRAARRAEAITLREHAAMQQDARREARMLARRDRISSARPPPVSPEA